MVERNSTYSKDILLLLSYLYLLFTIATTSGDFCSDFPLKYY